MNTRKAALDIMIEVAEHGAYLNDTLHVCFATAKRGEDEPTPQEKAFLHYLCTGCIKRLIEMDDRIDRYSKIKVRRMHPVVRNILRLGVYQIYYMESVPDAAAVNEAVKLAGQMGQKKSSGFINAILRAMLRNEKPYPYEEAPRDRKGMAVYYSVPRPLLDHLIEGYGREQTADILDAFLQPPPLTVRIHTSHFKEKEVLASMEQQGVRAYPVLLRKEPASPDGNGERPATEAFLQPAAYRLEHVGSIERLTAFQKGAIFVQDVSSMLPVALAGIKEGDTVIDVCAAPGGKSMFAADVLHDTGEVLARDISERKLRKIKENIHRAGFTNVSCKVWDAERTDETLCNRADVVLCDLPCSGLGVIKRKPEIKYRIKEKDILALAKMQRKMLAAAVRYVKVGGRLVYSTCTLTKEENEDNAAWFAKTYPAFLAVRQEQILPNKEQDGFFVAVFERKSEVVA